MNNAKFLFEILRENPLIFVRKFAITVPTGVLYFSTMFFLAMDCLSEDVPPVGRYIVVEVLLYMCVILPVNILIRLRQAHEKGIDFAEFVLDKEDVSDERIMDLPENSVKHVKKVKKHGMSEEELRCFALQCNAS